LHSSSRIHLHRKSRTGTTPHEAVKWERRCPRSGRGGRANWGEGGPVQEKRRGHGAYSEKPETQKRRSGKAEWGGGGGVVGNPPPTPQKPSEKVGELRSSRAHTCKKKKKKKKKPPSRKQRWVTNHPPKDRWEKVRCRVQKVQKDSGGVFLIPPAEPTVHNDVDKQIRNWGIRGGEPCQNASKQRRDFPR